MIFKPKADALSDAEEWEAIWHGEEDRGVEQGQLDAGPDMGVGVGAWRMGMDADKGRDHGTGGKGVNMGMGKMSMSKMSRDVKHACARLESIAISKTSWGLRPQLRNNPLSIWILKL